MGIVLPKAFTGHGYRVTVNADRSIIVKPGDWLSKYAMAIWGDYTEPHIKAFKRKINGVLRDVENPDLIRTGETLYVIGRLPGEIGIFPGEDQSGGALPSTGKPAAPKIPSSRIRDFGNWVWNNYLTCDWELAGTAGINLTRFFVSGQYMMVDVKQTATQVTGRFHNVAGGLALNYPKSVFGLSGSATFFPDCGFIRRSPWRKQKQLILEDFCHVTFVIEFNIALGIGTSPSMLFFGIGLPPWRVVRALDDFLLTGDPSIFGLLALDTGPKGVMYFAGLEASTPGIGLACRAGYMYDRRPWRAR
ncbi:MAG TPA: hypothetical protein VJ890_00755 [Vineibacter sp.]|nr:hypothetical protein [Vineibacter sp.]